MFKEQSTEKLIEYIQSLPGSEQKLIAQRITQPKTKRRAKSKLSSLKGKVTRIAAIKIDRQIKSLRGEWEKNI